MDTNFENMSKNLIKSELQRRDLKVKDLAEKIKPYGEEPSEKSLNI